MPVFRLQIAADIDDQVLSDRFCQAFDEIRNFLRPASTIDQKVSLACRRAIHVQRVAALRDLISVA
jgi:putative transposase